jgi:hypothetical protein
MLLMLKAADMKELGVTIGDRKRLQALIANLATNEVQQEEEDVVKQKAVVKRKQEAEANAKQEAEEKARGVEGEEAAKLEAEEKAGVEAEEAARLEAEKKAGVEAEEAARLKPEVEADEKERAIGGRMKKSVAQEDVERLPANERDRLESLPAGERERKEERLIEAEAEEKAKQEAEEKAKAEAEAKAKQEAEEKAKAEAEENAKAEAEERARGVEAKEVAKLEAEEEARVEAEEAARLEAEAEENAKAEADENAKAEDAEAKANAEAKNQSHLLVYLLYLPSIYHLLLVLHELRKESEENAKVKAVYLFSSFCFDISLLGEVVPCVVRLALPFVSPEQRRTVSFAVCVVIYFTNQFHLPIDDTKALIEAAVESSDRVSTTRVLFVHWSNNFGYQVLFSSIAPKPKTMPKAKTMVGAVFAEGKKIYKAGIKKMQSVWLQMLLSMHPVKMAYITCIPAQTPLGFSACTYVTPPFTSITLIHHGNRQTVGGGDYLWFGLSIMAFSRYAVELRPCSMQEDKALDDTPLTIPMNFLAFLGFGCCVYYWSVWLLWTGPVWFFGLALTTLYLGWGWLVFIWIPVASPLLLGLALLGAVLRLEDSLARGVTVVFMVAHIVYYYTLYSTFNTSFHLNYPMPGKECMWNVATKITFPIIFEIGVCFLVCALYKKRERARAYQTRHARVRAKENQARAKAASVDALVAAIGDAEARQKVAAAIAKMRAGETWIE